MTRKHFCLHLLNSTGSSPARLFSLPLRKASGFTLVELLVAMIIASIIFALGWKFLESTMSTSREVSSESGAIGEARTALQELTKNLQLAAAHGSPNSRIDPRVLPKSRTAVVGVVTGILPYVGWQTPTIWEDSGAQPQVSSSQILARNPQAVFDGLVILSSYDYPLSFETRIDSISLDQLTVPDTPQGLRRLINVNPFVVNNRSSSSNPMSDPQWPARFVRLLDAEGHKQFSGISSSTSAGGSLLRLSDPLVAKGAGQSYGVDYSVGGNDRLYDTSALDLFWFYVRKDPDPSNPYNLQLVRERLCARTALQQFGQNPHGFKPQENLSGSDCGDREIVVLANQVASFDVWFDCGTSSSMRALQFPLHGAPAAQGWSIDANSSCLRPDSNAHFERARLAHVRLSIHPKSERPQWTDRSTFFQAGRLVGFDFNPDYPGAAPVTTLQSDVFMRNFLYW